MSFTPDPTRAAPRELWSIASVFLSTFFNLFGAPQEIAAQGALTQSARAILAPWLRAGEWLMRRFVLIEAAAMPAPAPAPAARPRVVQVPRKRRLMAFYPDKPEDWRVTFRVFVGAGARRKIKARAPRTPRASCLGPRFFDAWPIAERCEALLRVFNDPLRYAARLARRLRAKPQTARALLIAPEGAPDLVGAEAFARVDAAACAAAALVFNSS